MATNAIHYTASEQAAQLGLEKLFEQKHIPTTVHHDRRKIGGYKNDLQRGWCFLQADYEVWMTVAKSADGPWRPYSATVYRKAAGPLQIGRWDLSMIQGNWFVQKTC